MVINILNFPKSLIIGTKAFNLHAPWFQGWISVTLTGKNFE